MWFTLRHIQTFRDSKHGSAILGSDSPQARVTIGEGNSIHPTWETWCQNNFRLFITTTVNTSACNDSDAALALPAPIRDLHWHCCWAEEPGGNLPEYYGQTHRSCSFPWIVASVPCSTANNRRNRSQMTQVGAKSTTTSSNPMCTKYYLREH